MNVKLLRKIQKHILEVPARFDMLIWDVKVDPLSTLTSCPWDANKGKAIKINAPECGTVCCIGGWAEILSESDNAVYALGISHAQSDRLFYNDGWPKKFADRYDRARTHRGRVLAAVARIDHFIKTRGKE